jgi:hypothetical protein
VLLVAAALFVPAAGDALLPWKPVRVTPTGPVPRVVEAIAGLTPVAWYNADGAGGRYVVFDDGSCKVRVTASEKTLRGCIPQRVGRHAYRVVGIPSRYARGVVVVVRGAPRRIPGS